MVEQELNLFDDSGLADVSDDGAQVLFGDRFGVYLRGHQRQSPCRINLGLTNAFADDLVARRQVGAGDQMAG